MASPRAGMASSYPVPTQGQGEGVWKKLYHLTQTLPAPMGKLHKPPREDKGLTRPCPELRVL